MNHRFDLRPMANGTAILFCGQCGTSYRVVEHRGADGIMQSCLEPIPFAHPTGERIDAPGACPFPDPIFLLEREREREREQAAQAQAKKESASPS